MTTIHGKIMVLHIEEGEKERKVNNLNLEPISSVLALRRPIELSSIF